MRSLALVFIALTALAACESAEERATKHYQNGLSLLESGDVDRAILEFRNVFQFDATHLEARKALGRVFLEEKKDKRRAYRQFLRIVEQYPDDLETRILLADIALGIGDWEEVNRHGGYVQDLIPDDPRVQAIALVRSYFAAVQDEDAAARRDIGREAQRMLEAQPESIFLRTIQVDASLQDSDTRPNVSSIQYFRPTHFSCISIFFAHSLVAIGLLIY